MTDGAADPIVVLVVDDDVDVRDTVADALEDDGYVVLRATNGQDALLQLEGGARPHLILLDLMMPEMDGWTFRAEQRRVPELAAIPVVVFTAHANPREAADQLGAAGALRKPLRLGELLAAVAQHAAT